jgi:thiol-disulfide isomerase/thioredoxin
VLVTRTFPKAHALAGMRIGVLSGPADLVAEVDGWRSRFNVTAPSQAAAVASLDDRAHLDAGVTAVSWCGPCEDELPPMTETAAATDEVVFLGINHVDQRLLAQRMVDEYGIDFATLRDETGEVVAEVGGRGLPHTVAFDTEGRLVSRVFGELTEASLDRLLTEVR